MGREFFGVVDCVLGNDPFSFIIVIASGVQIPFEQGKIAAGHLHSDAMSLLKKIAGRIQVYLNLIHSALFHPDFLGEYLPVSCP